MLLTVITLFLFSNEISSTATLQLNLSEHLSKKGLVRIQLYSVSYRYLGIRTFKLAHVDESLCGIQKTRFFDKVKTLADQSLS